MKKFFAITTLTAFPILAESQEIYQLPDGTVIPNTLIHAAIFLMFVYIGTSFLLTLVRLLLNFWLKSKLIGKGMGGPEVEKFIQRDKENKDYAVKWFLLFLGTGTGLAIIGIFPLGWLSVAILAFSLSMSFLAYLYYLNRKQR